MEVYPPVHWQPMPFSGCMLHFGKEKKRKAGAQEMTGVLN